MFFGKQKFNIKHLKMSTFITCIKQLVKQLVLIPRMLHLKYPRYAPAKVNKSFEKVNTNFPVLNEERNTLLKRNKSFQLC